MSNYICECGSRIVSPEYATHCRCGRTIDGEKIAVEPVDDYDPANPPTWVSLVRRFRKPEDAGIGDTVQRIAARFGGERFKKWSKRLGIPCGCTARQADWNTRWPY